MESRRGLLDDSEDDQPYLANKRSLSLNYKEAGTLYIPVKKWQAVIMVVIAAFFSLTITGVIFGWAPVENILLRDGAFENLCNRTASQEPSDISQPCDAQRTRLQLLFMISSTAFAWSVLPLGAVLDRFGPRLSATLGSFLVLAGSLMVAFSKTPHLDMYPFGFALMAIGGPPIVFSFLHLGNLLPNARGTIVTIFNVGLDASAVMFLLLSFISTHTSINDHRSLFIGFAILPALSLVLGLFLWPKKPYPATSLSVKQALTPVEPFSTILKSKDFWFCAAFVALCLLRVNFYIGTVGDQLSSMGRNPKTKAVQTYTDLFALILPAGGVASVPLVGLMLDKGGLLVSVFGTIWGGTSLLYWLPLEFQFLTFFFVALYRVMATFVFVTFGQAHFGKSWGVIFFIGGVINISEYFLEDAIYEYFNGKFFWFNVGLGGLSVLLFVYPFYLLISGKGRASVSGE